MQKFLARFDNTANCTVCCGKNQKTSKVSQPSVKHPFPNLPEDSSSSSVSRSLLTCKQGTGKLEDYAGIGALHAQASWAVNLSNIAAQPNLMAFCYPRAPNPLQYPSHGLKPQNL